MIDDLHDYIDDLESLGEEAEQIVEAVRQRSIEIMRKAGSIEEGINLIALAIENELAALTTKAVKKGILQAKKFMESSDES